jgi:hypothetical protein
MVWWGVDMDTEGYGECRLRRSRWASAVRSGEQLIQQVIGNQTMTYQTMNAGHVSDTIGVIDASLVLTPSADPNEGVAPAR